MNFSKTNWYRLILKSIKASPDVAQLEGILSPIIDAIKKTEEEFSTLPPPSEDNEDWYDYFVDEKAHYIEDLVGVVFVICQSEIDHIISDVKSLRKICLRDLSKKLVSVPETKADIIRFGIKLPCGHTAVEVIDAAGNLFKHGSEWRATWDPSTNKNHMTLMNAGAQPGSTGNFRTCFRAINAGASYSSPALMNGVLDWGKGLSSALEAELKGFGVL